jgi:Na+/proline symporter
LTLIPLDGAVTAAYFFFSIGAGFYYKSRADSRTAEFFLSGRNVQPSPDSASVME